MQLPASLLGPVVRRWYPCSSDGGAMASFSAFTAARRFCRIGGQLILRLVDERRCVLRCVPPH